ncbi:MAG: CBS domain-containing protein [Polaromonas sp.]|nr:CBS domain-containing protein [Polaromonas sp.]
MKIGFICTRRVATIDSAGTPIQAAALMRKHHVGTLVVTTQTPDGPHVSGIVTDRDLVINALAEGVDAISREIGALASRQIESVFEDDDVASAIAVMQGGGVRRLLVVNAEHRLVGIVSLDDLMAACASQIDGLVKAIRGGIENEVLDTLAAATMPLLLPMPVMRAATR